MRRRRVLQAGGVALAGGGAALSLVGAVSTDGDRGTRDASVLTAGSLAGVANRVPGGAVEAHGSVAARRLVAEGLREPDALALADPLLFRGLTEECTLFATNALVLAYDPDSAHADAIADDWRSALSTDGIRVGRTDPELDPLGYRTVMALRLAEGIDSQAALDDSTVHPEVAMMRNLEAGALDAAFIYRNMAVEHDLSAVDLPVRIDFSDPSRADRYANVSVEVDGRTIRGAPIRYGVRGLTPPGERWARDLATGAERLRRSGFVVPENYPRTFQTSKSGSSSGASYSDSHSM